MKCLILVGGYGTRLRPLTLSVPKPLIQFCNMSIVEHQIAAAVEAGCTEIILAVGYQPRELMAALDRFSEKYKVKMSVSVEEEPLGTAGPLRLAKDSLLAEGEPFFVLNSDVTCDYPLRDLFAFHKAQGRQATISVTPVQDPSKFGVVLFDQDTKVVNSFVEKPKDFVGNMINAGIYCISPEVIDMIPDEPCMFEKDIFPQLAQAGNLSCFELKGYWADIGQPKDYLAGMVLHLEGEEARRPAGFLAKTDAEAGYEIIGRVLVDPTATIGRGSVVGPNVTIAAGCSVGDGVRLKECALMDGVKVKNYATVSGSIIGWGSNVGKWARIDPLTVVGEDVRIGDELFINGALLLPHKAIKESVLTPGTIIM